MHYCNNFPFLFYKLREVWKLFSLVKHQVHRAHLVVNLQYSFCHKSAKKMLKRTENRLNKIKEITTESHEEKRETPHL